MKRKEIYAEIKRLGLQDQIKKQFNVSYTNVPTVDLADFIDKNKSKILNKNDNKIDLKKSKETATKTPIDFNKEHSLSVAFINLVATLVANKVITPDDGVRICGEL